MKYDFGEEHWFCHAEFWKHLFAPWREKEVQLLELGSWKGESAVWLLENLPLAQLTCIDTWALERTYLIPESQFHSEERKRVCRCSQLWEIFQANVQEFGSRVRPIRATTAEGLGLLAAEGAKFDFAYIDAGHLKEEVVADYLDVRPLVKVGGLIYFDDYDWSTQGHFTIREAIAELGLKVEVIDSGALLRL